MKTIFFNILFLFTLPFIGNAADTASLFQQAGEHYSAGDYQTAIAEYQEIITENGYSPQVLHNMANCYAAVGQNGQAVLNYLRALHLAPSDADTRGDLASLRKHIGLYEKERSLPMRIIQHYDMNQWLQLALLSYILLTILVLAGTFLKKRGWKCPCAVLAAIAACIAILCLGGAWEQRTAWQSGVIVQEGTNLLVSPFDTAASAGTLKAGSIASDEKEHNGYLYVKDDRGHAGWIARDYFAKINQ